MWMYVPYVALELVQTFADFRDPEFYGEMFQHLLEGHHLIGHFH